MEKTKLGMSQNVEAAICYSLPFIAFLSGLVMLVLETENKLVRFHAMQSFILFGAYGVIGFVLSLVPFIGGMLTTIFGIVMLVSWVVCIVNAYRGEYFKFPYVGEAVYQKIVG